jgi:hypothetical protein
MASFVDIPHDAVARMCRYLDVSTIANLSEVRDSFPMPFSPTTHFLFANLQPPSLHPCIQCFRADNPDIGNYLDVPGFASITFVVVIIFGNQRSQACPLLKCACGTGFAAFSIFGERHNIGL